MQPTTPTPRPSRPEPPSSRPARATGASSATKALSMQRRLRRSSCRRDGRPMKEGDEMHLHRQIVILAAAAFIGLPCAASATPSAARTHMDNGREEADGAAVVIAWNQTLITALATAGTPAPIGTRLGALVQSAVFDAVNGIERRYTPIHVQPAAPRGGSRHAAAAGAAHEALVALFPSQRAMLDAQLATSLAALDEEDSDDES